MTRLIRDETPADAAAIEAVTISAFTNSEYGLNGEHRIVADLRKHRALALSLVAEEENRIVGHVAVSPVSISDGSKGWFGLGPISVLPDRQRTGIGTELMQHSLARMRTMGAAGCVLVGDPHYYTRFGFAPTVRLVFPDLPADYFLAISFCGQWPSGNVTYHKSFCSPATEISADVKSASGNSRKIDPTTPL